MITNRLQQQFQENCVSSNFSQYKSPEYDKSFWMRPPSFSYSMSWRQFECISGMHNDFAWAGNRQISVPSHFCNQFADPKGMEYSPGLAAESKPRTWNQVHAIPGTFFIQTIPRVEPHYSRTLCFSSAEAHFCSNGETCRKSDALVANASHLYGNREEPFDCCGPARDYSR